MHAERPSERATWCPPIWNTLSWLKDIQALQLRQDIHAETLWMMTTRMKHLFKISHFVAPIVTRDSRRDPWMMTLLPASDTSMMKSYSAAPIVTRFSRKETLWKGNMMSTSLKHLVMIKSHSGPAIVTRDSRRDPLNDDHKDETPFQNKKPFCCSHCDKRFTQRDPLKEMWKMLYFV